MRRNRLHYRQECEFFSPIIWTMFMDGALKNFLRGIMECKFADCWVWSHRVTPTVLNMFRRIRNEIKRKMNINANKGKASILNKMQIHNLLQFLMRLGLSAHQTVASL